MIDFIATQKAKLSTPYGFKSAQAIVKDFDATKRIVTGLYNSYFYIDHDADMLVTGAATASIEAKGPGTTSGNKIKHLKDHDWRKVIARINVLDERVVTYEGKQIEGIYFESFYPDTQDSNDMLIKIQEGLYDDRSIGFIYERLGLAERDSSDEDRKARWDEFYPQALNPEKADELGFFWVVKQIDFFEGSDVAFGANQLTPMLGVKEKDKTQALDRLFKRIDGLSNFAKSLASDEAIQAAEMEKEQIKAYIAHLINDNTFRDPKSESISKVKLIV